MAADNLWKRYEKHVTPALTWDTKIRVKEAAGSYVTGWDGARYLDWSAGTAVNITGHRHPKVMAAVERQLRSLVHSGGVYLYDSLVELVERLASVTPGDLDMFFPSNAGTEVVEGAIKLSRYVTRRQGVIAFRGAFHGRTTGSAAITSSNSKYSRHYHPLMGGVHYALFPNPYRFPADRTPAQAVDECFNFFKGITDYQIAPDDVACVIVEPVQGEGGYIVPPSEFLKMVRRFCDEHGIMLVFDEVQSGVARTGHWFAADHHGVVPDIMAIAKGIASGFPLALLAGRTHIMKQWSPGAHGTTFGGNPVSCAAAVATIDLIREEKLIERSRKLSDVMMKRFKGLVSEYDFVGDARGIGYMLALEFVTDRASKTPDGKRCGDFLAACFDAGLIMISAGKHGNVVRILPPVTSTATEIEEGIDKIERAIETIARKSKSPAAKRAVAAKPLSRSAR